MDAEPRWVIPDRVGIRLSLVLFGVPALALWLATALVVPALVGRGWEPLSAWFLAGMLVLGPLLAAALLGAWMAVPTTSLPAILEHLRVRRLSAHDWRIAGLALAVTIVAMTALQILNAMVWPQLPPHPPFMTAQPLEPPQRRGGGRRAKDSAPKLKLASTTVIGDGMSRAKVRLFCTRSRTPPSRKGMLTGVARR